MAETAKKSLLPGEHEDGDLDFPFEFPLGAELAIKGERSKVLILEEPSADLVLKHNLLYGMSNDSAAAVIAEMSGATDVVVKQMKGKDFIKLVAVLSRFFAEAAR